MNFTPEEIAARIPADIAVIMADSANAVKSTVPLTRNVAAAEARVLAKFLRGELDGDVSTLICFSPSMHNFRVRIAYSVCVEGDPDPVVKGMVEKFSEYMVLRNCLTR